MKHIRKKKHKKKEVITDHAIVQFLHRTGVLNIKHLRSELMTPGLKRAISESRDNESILEHSENGLQFVIQSGNVKTILTYDNIRLPNGKPAPIKEGTRPIPGQ